jgi:hypothetical protein
MALTPAERQRRYRERHPDKVKASIKKYTSTDEYRAKAREKMRQRRAEKPDENREYCRRWYKANPDKVRAQKLKSQYGLTPEQWDAMFAAQGGVCAACGSVPARPVVDHCHSTGKVRGIVCDPCNLILGHADDDPNHLRQVAAYLER